MKKVIFVTILISNVLLSDSTSNRYGVTNSLHSNSNKMQIQEDLKKALKKKEEYSKKIQEIVKFMENFKMLSDKQREEAKQFQEYVDSHIKSIASCQNLENDFRLDKEQGISNYEEKLYLEEIQECKADLEDNTISYKSAENFFSEALDTLNKLKTKNKIAGKRYKRLQDTLLEVNALVDYLNTGSK